MLIHEHMSEDELNSIIENLSRRLLNNDENHDENRILLSYKEKDWEKWIIDILEIKIAYPISRISSNGDVLSDMVFYLREHNITTRYYEKSISHRFMQEYYQNPNNIFLLERLIDVLVHLCGDTANKSLIELLSSKINSSHKGKNSYLKTNALLALSKSYLIDSTYKENILNYIILQGLHEMKHDPYFYSTCLRFCYYQITTRSFFNLLTIIINEIDKWENNHLVKDNILHLLIDKIDELFYHKTSIFYSNLFTWVLDNNNPDDLNSLYHNKYYKRFTSILTTLIEMNSFPLQGPKNIKLNEIYYKDSVEILLSILANQDISPSKHLKNPEYLIEIFSFIGENSINSHNLIEIMRHESKYVVSVSIRLIPEIIKEDDFKDDSFICNIIESIDEITSNNKNMESSKLAILSFLS